MNPQLIRLIARLLELADESQSAPPAQPAPHRAALTTPNRSTGGVGHVALLGYN